MNQDAMLDAKVADFFEWLRSFEAEVHQIGGGARRYVGHAIEATIRYSWFKPSTAGRPSICLADFELAQPQPGGAFLERLATWFMRTPHALQAQVLYVEQPQDGGLSAWLGGQGFRLCSASGDDVQSWYLQRTECPTRATAQPTAAARLPELKSYDGDDARRSARGVGMRTSCKAPVPLDARRLSRLAGSQVSLPRWPLVDATRARAS